MRQFFVIGFATIVAMVQATASADTIKTATDLQSALNKGLAGRTFEVELHIILPPKMKFSAFSAEDSTGIIRLCDHRPDGSQKLSAGDRVIVSGTTVPAPNATTLIAACRSIRFIAHDTLPEAKIVPVNDFLLGLHDNRRVALLGTVKDVFNDDVDNLNAFMVLDSGGQSVYITYRETRDACTILQEYVGCDVLVTGIGGKISPGSRKFPSHVFGIGTTNDIKIVRRPASDRFDAPDIGKWRAIDPQEIFSAGTRHAQGTVIARWHGDTILLKDDSGHPVRIVCATQPLPGLNARIETVGIPTTDLFNINLKRAIWRPCGASASVHDSDVARTSLSLLFRGQAGYPLIRSASHGKVICVEGLVKGLLTDEDGNRRILLADGPDTILVDCSDTPSVIAPGLEGARISVTGVCIMESDDWTPSSAFPRVKGLFIVPRTTGDLKVLSRPPWWTPRRLLVVLASMLVLIVVILVWNAALRKLVERRSRAVIRAQEKKIESELRIMERTRLAAEIHDSLAQNLTVIAYQTSAAMGALGETNSKAAAYLVAVLKMLKSCRVDLRRCLWDLRNDVLDVADFKEAIRRTTQPVAGTATISVRFAGLRSRINDTTAHAVLCILRELVANAVQHGQAKNIHIVGELRNRCIRFNVRDDGIGFDPQSCPGQNDGHFGLGGIRERLKRLNGRLSFEPNSPTGMCAHIIINIPSINASITPT